MCNGDKFQLSELLKNITKAIFLGVGGREELNVVTLEHFPELFRTGKRQGLAMEP